jgi:predicted DNA-binding transcriptional regulator YafY
LLRIVAEAVWATRRLRLRYESWDKIVERDLDPLGLVLKAGVWYLVARADHSVRTYRVAKILEAAAREDGFAYPAGFDLAAHWKQAAKTFEESVYRDEAVLVVTERGRKLLRARGAAVDRAVVKTAKPAGAGRWRVTIPIESVEQAKRELLSLGAEGEVISPAPLRAAIGDEATAVAALYAKTGRKARRLS